MTKTFQKGNWTEVIPDLLFPVHICFSLDPTWLSSDWKLTEGEHFDKYFRLLHYLVIKSLSQRLEERSKGQVFISIAAQLSWMTVPEPTEFFPKLHYLSASFVLFTRDGSRSTSQSREPLCLVVLPQLSTHIQSSWPNVQPPILFELVIHSVLLFAWYSGHPGRSYAV